jgi:predicted TIM-barrel fold metal-dependent hydrolase
VIYDGHAYCFPDQRGDGGFADRAEFQRNLQVGMAGHFQPAWRVRDRAPADSSGLYDASKGLTFDALKDADFRAAGHGRFEWTVDGEHYAKQVMPPSIADMSYPAESLVAEMDYAGVDRALLHRTPYLGIGNDFIADCVRAYPERIQGLAHVEEWLVAPEPDASIARLERAIGEQGLSGVQFLTNYLRLYGQTDEWDGPAFRPFWDAVSGMDIPVFFTPSGWVGSQQGADAKLRSYLSDLKTLSRWTERYPDVEVVLTHGFNWRLFLDRGTLSVPGEVFDAAPVDNPNFSVQLLFGIALGGEFDYPMVEMRPTLEKLGRLIGARRLMWGTDMPMVMRYYTYRQNLELMRGCRDIFDADEMDLVLGGNMERLMGLDKGSAK